MSKIDLDKLICSLFIQANGKPGFKFRMSNVLEALAEQGLEFDGKDIVEKYRLRGIITGKPSPAVKEVVDSLTPEVMEEAKKELEQKGNKKYLGTSDEYVGHKLHKFDVGDWIIKENYSAQQVIKLREESYILNGSISGIETLPKKYVENNYHLWTIRDAKAGDVLEYEGEVFIFKGAVFYHTVVYHCCYDGRRFIPHSVYSLLEDDFANIHPATEGLRHLLFQKMHEAGYEWDAEKKELRKIEQKPAWSEEDVLAIERIIDTIQCAQLTRNGKPRALYTDEILDNLVNWLKSLRPQNRWKPSDAQMASITCAVRKMKESTCYDSELVSLFNDLKKLREE